MAVKKYDAEQIREILRKEEEEGKKKILIVDDELGFDYVQEYPAGKYNVMALNSGNWQWYLQVCTRSYRAGLSDAVIQWTCGLSDDSEDGTRMTYRSSFDWNNGEI